MTERSGAKYPRQKKLFKKVNALAMGHDILSPLNLSHITELLHGSPVQRIGVSFWGL